MSVQHFSDEQLILKLTQTEDSFVERKSNSDMGGWLKSVVAFANSLPVGRSAVLFLGVSDEGQIAAGTNTERTMQKFSDFISQHAWPPILTFQQELTVSGMTCVAVTIPHSEDRPHFAGRAYIRDGTQTKDASAAQYVALLSSRNSKARAILEHLGKEVTWLSRLRNTDGYASGRTFVKACTQHHVTVEMYAGSPDAILRTEPLSRIELALDHKREGRLEIIFYEDR